MMKQIPYDKKRLKGLVKHHTATTAGYVSRLVPGEMFEYRGHFGRGIAVKTNNPDSTKYCYITYYVEE